MATRTDVSSIQNKYNDAQRIDKSDMDVEQDHNTQNTVALINNHFGSGVLLSSITQAVLFDSDDLSADAAALVASGNFDGTGISVDTQPSDINLGNQLEVELTGSDVFGRLCIKVAIVGLSFDDTLQMDRFYFYKNEKQVTSKHYKEILSVFFCDFKGNNNCSRNLGGRITIKETSSFQLSRDPIMIAQDVEPDLFWRDFKTASTGTSLLGMIQQGIGNEYDVDALDINTTGTANKTLEADDVVSHVGQKFIAKTDNIQKITLLLGVFRDEGLAEPNQFDWSGDLVVSVYPLQTSVTSPSDIVPELAIDFDPSAEPLVQLSYDQADLLDIGYVLTDVLQPVDFVFSATKLGRGTTSKIVPGKYYAVTIKRSGAASTGEILIGVGNDHTDDSCVTLYNGVWVDVPEEDLWFQVWTDAAKIADGQGYDAGNGIIIPKTSTDSETGAIIDHQERYNSFAYTGAGQVNVGIIQAVTDESVTVQDERTGNNVNSRQQFVPSFSFISEDDLDTLKETSVPLVIGAVKDNNPKLNSLIEKTQTYPGLARNDTFCIINPDADLLNQTLIGSKLVPNSTCCNDSFRIFKVTLCTDGYGDVNGDGYIDSTDISLASDLVGESLYFDSTQEKILDGYFTTLELLRADVNGDGYVTSDDVDLITQYVNRSINSFPIGTSFTHMCLQVQQPVGRYDGYFDCDGYVRLDGLGINIIDPDELSESAILFDGYLSTVQIDSDEDFSTVPFAGVTYQIIPQPYWMPHLLALSSDVRLVPAAFTENNAITQATCGTAAVTTSCEDLSDATPYADPGRNDIFFPDDIYLGKGELKRQNGDYYKVDFEVGTVILQLPDTPLAESSINIFTKFVADRGDGLTRAGYPAMRYADCTTVQDTDLASGKVKFGVSLQSFNPNLDGYDLEDGYGVIVDPIIGIHMDSTNGILKISMQDLDVDQVYLTLVSKIQIMVYLKKAGWNNQVLVIEPEQIEGLISS